MNPDRPTPFIAAALYVALSLVLTWPLALGIASDVPGDLGDSLLNMWILAWGAEHLPRLLTGAITWAQFWNGNIFHPEPLTFALSEHLTGLTVQILPVYWLTGNIVLCYNLLFLSSFALSGLGTFLLVRDLTGNARAAFIAGLIYGFLPYRIASVPHLQVLSSQWMPFVLWGLNRFFTRYADPASRLSALRALALGIGALILQNLSCVYYVFFFAPFLLLFVLHRITTARLIRNSGMWAALAAGGVVTLAVTLPFLLPYRDAHEQFGVERAVGEAEQFSANLWSYFTASENVRLWGRVLRLHPYAEGETFLGFTALLLAAVAIVALLASPEHAASRTAAAEHRRSDGPRWRRAVIWVLAFAALTQFIALMSTMIFGGFRIDVLGIPIRARTASRLLVQFLLPTTILFAMSVTARRQAMRLLRSPLAFFVVALVLAVWLSLGPVPAAGYARATGFGLYGVLYDLVPGFNGLRVPARFAMIAGLFLAALGGFGAARILGAESVSPNRPDASGTRRRTTIFAALAILILMEGAAIPFEINRTWNMHEATPPARVMPYAQRPAVYRRVEQLPPDAVLTEFPFGDGAWEIRYVYYAAAHWRPITNGYSGGFPPGYKERVAHLQRIAVDPDAAWQSLRGAGTTHVIVHRNAFAKSADADVVEQWLRAHDAQELERLPDGDVLWQLN